MTILDGDLSRRRFLIGAGAVATVAATATVIPFPEPLALVAEAEAPAIVFTGQVFSGAIARAGSLLWWAWWDYPIVDGNGDKIVRFSVEPAEEGPEVRMITIGRDPETLRLVFSPDITEIVFVRAGRTYVRRGDIEQAVDLSYIYPCCNAEDGDD